MIAAPAIHSELASNLLNLQIEQVNRPHFIQIIINFKLLQKYRNVSPKVWSNVSDKIYIVYRRLE
jgi:hypothetical protein